jgi:hypothetical protein
MIYPVVPIHKRMNSEYAWILAELRRLGLTPTGDIDIDRAQVQEAKQKESEDKEEISFDKFIFYKGENSGETEREKMEYERVGAMNVALINRILLQI